MGRVRLLYVNSFTDNRGRTRHYFRRNGKRIALPGFPGSPEFMAAYQAALGEGTPQPAPRAKVEPRSFADLAQRYYASPDYLRLAPSTKANYRISIDAFLAAHGHRSVAGMGREHVTAIIGRMADRPGSAKVMLARLKTLAAFAIALGWIRTDPTLKVKSFRLGTFHTWTEAEIAQFEDRWPVGTKQRTAFALHLFTGQRRSDVVRMSWRDYDGGTITVTQKKTNTKLALAAHPALKFILDTWPRDGFIMLMTEWGLPFSVGGYGVFMASAIKRAGLPDHCVLHGLRKAAARRLAEAGCTAHEIAAITGHRTLEEVERYTKEADQKRLAKAAIRKQTGGKR